VLGSHPDWIPAKKRRNKRMNFGAIKEGFLTKCAPTRKSWKRRWFILQDNLIYYFKNKQKDQVATGTILLADVQKVVRRTYDNKDNCFLIETQQRMWYQFADSPTERDDWIIAITVVKDTHQLRNLYKEPTPGLLGPYRSQLLMHSKNMLINSMKLSGILKGIGARSSIVDIPHLIEADLKNLSEAVLQMCFEALEVVSCPYDAYRHQQLHLTGQYTIAFARLLKSYGEGNSNESAVFQAVKNVESECASILALEVPDPKLEWQVMQKDIKFNETKFMDGKDKEDVLKLLSALGKHIQDVVKLVGASIKEKEAQTQLTSKANEAAAAVKAYTESLQAASYFNNEQTVSDLSNNREKLNSSLEQLTELCSKFCTSFNKDQISAQKIKEQKDLKNKFRQVKSEYKKLTLDNYFKNGSFYSEAYYQVKVTFNDITKPEENENNSATQATPTQENQNKEPENKETENKEPENKESETKSWCNDQTLMPKKS